MAVIGHDLENLSGIVSGDSKIPNIERQVLYQIQQPLTSSLLLCASWGCRFKLWALILLTNTVHLKRLY